MQELFKMTAKIFLYSVCGHILSAIHELFRPPQIRIPKSDLWLVN